MPAMKALFALRATRASAVLCVLTGLLLPGCDKVGDLVDEAKNQVTDAKPEPAASSTAAPAAAEPTPMPVVAPAAPVVNPQELAAALMALEPRLVDDGALGKVADVPDAAALITKIDVTGSRISMSGMNAITKFSNLTELNLNGQAGFMPEGFAMVGQLKNLKSLDLHATEADDRALAALGQMAGLEKLNLEQTKITAAGLAPISGLGQVQELNLSRTGISDESIQAIGRMPLRKLTLNDTRITNASMQVIGGISTLEELSIARTGIDGGSLKGLQLPALRHLNLAELNIQAEGLKYLKGHKTLEELIVYQAGIVEGKEADVFGSFPSLKLLNLGSNQITDQGVFVMLKGLKKLETLELANMEKITDRGLFHLIAMKNLRYLNVTRTSCSAVGGKALKEKLPECRIVTPGGEF